MRNSHVRFFFRSRLWFTYTIIQQKTTFALTIFKVLNLIRKINLHYTNCCHKLLRWPKENPQWMKGVHFFFVSDHCLYSHFNTRIIFEVLFIVLCFIINLSSKKKLHELYCNNCIVTTIGTLEDAAENFRKVW